MMSIRKEHYIKNNLAWDEDYYQKYGTGMYKYMFYQKFLPAGRKLWGYGTDYVAKHGSIALNNCGAISTGTNHLGSVAKNFYYLLAHGVGVGFDTKWKGTIPAGKKQSVVIDDTISDIAKSIETLLDNQDAVFDYSKIRKKGSVVSGFGGLAVGPEPIKCLHTSIRDLIKAYTTGCISSTRFIADLFNKIGIAAVAGGVRRSAEICLGKISDDDFISLKDYDKHPERSNYGYMSNNTVVFEDSSEFEDIPKLASLIKKNGEPGFINMKNVKKYGRYGQLAPDDAILCNPCGEIPLESYELCNLATTIPINCSSASEWYKALEYATFCCCTTSLLMTDIPEINKVISKNRRIGVSITGIADRLYSDKSTAFSTTATKLVDYLRDGYKLVVNCADNFNKDAGVPKPIRYTTIKPEGTISLLSGVSPGIHFPLGGKMIRRMSFSKDSNLSKYLMTTGLPYEESVYNKDLLTFSFPLESKCTRFNVSAWEQFCLVALFQREWSDNMVSCTVTFDETDNLENIIAYFMPIIKGVSLLPRNVKTYKQMPYEITDDLSALKKIQIDLSGIEIAELKPSFCTNDTCHV
jgi:ribonucleoside-diphosphate reductase alpha chain